jgi:hypothetical protein
MPMISEKSKLYREVQFIAAIDERGALICDRSLVNKVK